MQRAARTAFPILIGLFLACGIGQVFLAGLGVFDDPRAFITHREFGYTFGWLTILALVTALAGRMPRRFVGACLLLIVLFTFQSVFVALRTDMPSIAALHPLNGFLILAVAAQALRSSLAYRSSWLAEQQPASATAASAEAAEA